MHIKKLFQFYMGGILSLRMYTDTYKKKHFGMKKKNENVNLKIKIER